MISDLSYSTISKVLGKWGPEVRSFHDRSRYNVIHLLSLSNTNCLRVSPCVCPTETWEQARRSIDFESYVGSVVLLKMFEYEPQTKEVFGFKVDENPTAQELKDSGNLKIAISIIQRLDACLNLLGPDGDLVSMTQHMVLSALVCAPVQSNSYLLRFF